jgi:hypothetical protein
MKQYRFVKEDGGWYIDLPEYLEKGGSKGDLAMVAGADTMLDIIAAGNKTVDVTLDTTPFAEADLIELVEVCAPSMGGGYYVMQNYNGQPVKHRMWLCDVTNFVFGYLPPAIYIKVNN